MEPSAIQPEMVVFALRVGPAPLVVSQPVFLLALTMELALATMFATAPAQGLEDLVVMLFLVELTTPVTTVVLVEMRQLELAAAPLAIMARVAKISLALSPAPMVESVSVPMLVTVLTPVTREANAKQSSHPRPLLFLPLL